METETPQGLEARGALIQQFAICEDSGMDDNNKEIEQPPNQHSDLRALSEAISLAPLGVLSSQTIVQLVSLRDRLGHSSTTPD